MRLICVTCAVAALAFGVAFADPPEMLKDIQISGNKTTGTKSCGGGTASILGNKHKLTLKGCTTVKVLGNANKLTLVGARALEVSGNKNVVDAGQVGSISTMGNNNTVTYKIGPKKEKPKISNLGKDNKISGR